MVDAASTPQAAAARPAGSFERALEGAALGAATAFATASGTLAEYVDPDDVSRLLYADFLTLVVFFGRTCRIPCGQQRKHRSPLLFKYSTYGVGCRAARAILFADEARPSRRSG